MEPSLTREDLELEINLTVRLEAICRRQGETQAADQFAAVLRALKAELAAL